MASLADLTQGIKPVVAYPKTISFGPVTLDGYMLEDGSFRQSITSTERALGAEGSKLIQRMLIPRYKGSSAVLTGLTQEALQQLDSGLTKSEKGHDPQPVILPIICPNVAGHSGNYAYTINLPMVVEAWKHIAIGGGKYSRQALELLGLSAIHSLERAYQEAFGVTDARTTEERLLEWGIRLDTASHFPMFGREFHKHFARVTGVAIGHNYARTCLAELVYHRLPKEIYDALKDLNPSDPASGWRQYTHSQLMTDGLRDHVKGIVMAVTNQLANTASKSDDPKAYKKLLHRLDKTLPRHAKRGNKFLSLSKNNANQAKVSSGNDVAKFI